MRRAAWLLLLLSAAAGCAGGPGGPLEAGGPGFAGRWRAVLESPGGELPFLLTIETRPDGGLSAASVNGAEALAFTTVERSGRDLLLRYDHLDSEIRASLSDDGLELRGSWTRQALRQRQSMVFRAVKGELPRFGPAPGEPGPRARPADVSGVWDVTFTDEEGVTPARAELELEGRRLTGTFLTPTGDYRFLEGDYHDGLLRLSCFDGGHAFLFVARARTDGTLAGDFWSRATYHASWSARRPGDARAAGAMPDPFADTRLANPAGRLSFSFPDLDGRLVSSDDPRFQGKVLLVDIFGSWCPNCNDQAPVLVDLYRRHHDAGLEIVGLAYEMTGDPARDAVYVRRFGERYGAAWPLLLAGTSDKAEASLTLPDLSGVLAFPTLVFVGRDGRVAAIHTGFAGPGTGSHFEDLRAEYEKLIERLLGEDGRPRR